MGHRAQKVFRNSKSQNLNFLIFLDPFKSKEHETSQKSETSTLKLRFNQGWLLKTGTKNEQISDFANFYYINNATLQHIMSPGVHRVVKGGSNQGPFILK